MSNVIMFDRERAKKAIAEQKKNNNLPSLISGLQAEIEGAQQAYQSFQLVRGGYCGSGLKREIAQANSLPERLKNAGLIVQQIIMEAK